MRVLSPPSLRGGGAGGGREPGLGGVLPPAGFPLGSPPVPLPLCGARDTSLRGGASGGQGRPGGVTTTGRSRAASEAGGAVGVRAGAALVPFTPHLCGGWGAVAPPPQPPHSVGVLGENKVWGRAAAAVSLPLPPRSPRRGARRGWEPAATRLSGDCAPHRRCYGPGPPLSLPGRLRGGRGEDARRILPLS